MFKLSSLLTRLRSRHSVPPASPSKKDRKKQMRKDYETLRNSPLFDSEWYLAQNPDVVASRVDPIRHYLNHGWQEGRKPSAQFDGTAYLNANPDVKRSGMNPLIHYINHGVNENRVMSCKAAPGKAPQPAPAQPQSPAPVPAPVPAAPQPTLIPRSTDVFFSVIVTCYNNEVGIKDTLKNLVKQSYQDFEVIVVDDGSEDDSVAIIKEYASSHEKIQFFQHPEAAHLGRIATVDLALRHAHGEYIAFCEADAYWTPDHLAQVNHFIRKSRGVIIVNDVEAFGDVDRLRRLKPVIEDRRHALRRTGGIVPPHVFREANYIPTWSGCCVYSLLLQSCNITDCTHDELIFWWIGQQVSQGEKIFFLDKKLTHWRIDQSTSARLSKSEIDEVESIDAFKTAMDKIKKARAYESSASFNSSMADFGLFDKLENKRSRSRIIQQICEGDFKNLKVLYVTTTGQFNRPILDASSRYRCYHGAEAINRRGGYAFVQSTENFVAQPNYDYDLYIFHRPSSNAFKVIQELQSLNKILVAEYDDLIFGHAREAMQSSIYKNNVRPLETVIGIFANNLKALQMFDYVSVSTANLKKAVLRFNPGAKVGVIHNFIPNSIIHLAERLRWAETPKNLQTLMYCSGTLSHNKDFPIAEDAILKALDLNQNMQFIVQGVLDAASVWTTRSRVYFHPPVGYWDLFPIMLPAAFNIAPLEMSPFNDCKSNVKFLEASLTGNLLIASPIEDMQRVSDAHIFLPSTAEEWEYYLTHLEELYSPQKAQENFQYIKKNCSENTFEAEFRSLFEH